MKEIIIGLGIICGTVLSFTGLLWLLGNISRIVEILFIPSQYTPPEDFEETIVRGLRMFLILFSIGIVILLSYIVGTVTVHI
jgi:hypothetical protein